MLRRLTANQAAVLGAMLMQHIEDAAGEGVSGLMHRTKLTKHAVSRALTGLAERGLVERNPLRRDGEWRLNRSTRLVAEQMMEEVFDLAGKLAEEFDTEEADVEGDIHAFVGQLLDSGILEARPGEGKGVAEPEAGP